MNIRRNLTIVMTQLCGLLLLCSGAWAQQTLINFDDVPNGTVLNTQYAGVTFSKSVGNSYVTSHSQAPSPPHMVPADDRFVTATFSTPQLTVSIDVRPGVRYEFVESVTAGFEKPYLKVYAGSTFLGEARFAGPLPTGNAAPGLTVETLTFTSSSANITRVQFGGSTKFGEGVYGLFDNLRFGTTSLLFYDSGAGLGAFWRTNGSGDIFHEKSHIWSHSWSQIIPGDFGGDGNTDLFFYDSQAGLADFYLTDGFGNITHQQRHNNLHTGWTQIIPGNFGGTSHTDFLFYDSSTGWGEFWLSDGQGGMVFQAGYHLSKSWTVIVPGNFGGSEHTDLLFYDAGAGLGAFWLTDGQGGIIYQASHFAWSQSWAKIIPLRF
jgi:hypothetical protein